jgi:hypothetical protein
MVHPRTPLSALTCRRLADHIGWPVTSSIVFVEQQADAAAIVPHLNVGEVEAEIVILRIGVAGLIQGL